jgi:DNA mismatch repair protein PMS2
MVRCSKARAMFAMRACRKSVMIGKSLTKAQMVQVKFALFGPGKTESDGRTVVKKYGND